MTDINSVVVIGRLTRDARIKTMDNGDAAINFSVAVNGARKSGSDWVDDPSFFDVSYFTRGDSIMRYLEKGTRVCVSGHLKQERWTGEDGENRSKVAIRAISLQLLGAPRDGAEAPRQPENDQIQEPTRSAPAPESQPALDGFSDDIPF